MSIAEVLELLFVLASLRHTLGTFNGTHQRGPNCYCMAEIAK